MFAVENLESEKEEILMQSFVNDEQLFSSEL